MMNVDINVVKIAKFWGYLNTTVKRINILYGGAGSGKSYQIALFLLFQKFIREHDISILITRKTMPSLRISAYKLITNFISQYRLADYLPIEHHKTSATLRFKDNEINFIGLDDPEKLKSAEWNYIWAEEATDLALEDYRQLNLRLRRRTTGLNQMFLSLNPIDAFHWINTELLEKEDPDVGSLHSTYKDNPFLPAEYTKELEKLKEQDLTLYNIYAQGLWGILQNLIYTNWDIVDEFPTVDDIFYGMDFGSTDPCAIVQCGVLENDIFLKELLYERELTPTRMFETTKDIIRDNNALIYADSNRPEFIREMQQTYPSIVGAEKGPGSVLNGIDFVKKFKLHVEKGSSNLIKELKSYKRREVKGRVIDEPVKYNDHLLDALRYAIFSHLSHIPQLIW